MNLDIIIYLNGMEINTTTLEKKSLGGSETAGIAMAHALQKRGHHVTVFCNTNTQGKHKGVNYLSLEAFEQYAINCPHDVLIVQRVPEVFKHRFNSKINILWQHDFAQKSRKDVFTGALWNVDKVFCLSDWHINNYKEINGIQEDELFFKTSNGVKLIQPKTTKRKKRVVFTNRPERGLDIFLYNICPRLWEHDKEIEVAIAGYDNTVPQMKPYYDKLFATINEYAKQGYNIKHLGALNKKDLYTLYLESKIFAYPTMFYETSCITAMETQMCGLPMITSNRGALPETLSADAGIIIDGQATNVDYQDKFVKGCIDLLSNDVLYKKCQKAGYENVKQYEWDNVAEKWEREFMRIFESNTSNRQTLYKHLYEREDIMALKYLVEFVDNDAEWKAKIQSEYSYIGNEELYKQKYLQLGKEYAKIEDNFEVRMYPRVEIMLNDIGAYLDSKEIEKYSPPKVLDFASGIGNEAILMANKFNAEVDCVNISPEENKLGEKMKKRHAPKAKIKFHEGCNAKTLVKTYDVLFLGEILEHQESPDYFIDDLEKNLKDDGLVSISVPYGMWDDERKAHLWNYDRQDLAEMFANKKDLSIKVVSAPLNVEKNEVKGWWVVTYKKNGKLCNPIPLERKIRIQQPRETVTACMITLNAEDMLHRCLKSIRNVADEIIIADNGSTDSTLLIAKQYGAKIIPCKKATEIGFDSARNISIRDAKSDWILWIDSDEELLNPQNLRKYQRQNIFNGYSIRQHHFTIDVEAFKIDLPVRMFRNNKEIKFLGYVHEHPEIETNDGVGMSTVISDVDIAHDGYLTENVRRNRFVRNIGLMKKDRELNPDRLLGKFLWIRDLVHLARYELQNNQMQPTQQAIDYCREAQELFRKEFLNDCNLYQEEALQFYSESLIFTNEGIEYRFNINAGLDGVKAEHKDNVGRFLNTKEFNSYIKSRYKNIAEQYTGEFL